MEGPAPDGTQQSSRAEGAGPGSSRGSWRRHGHSVFGGLLVLAGSQVFAGGDATPAGLRYVFPENPAVLDARRHLGARGDGVTDDTEALQRGIDLSSDRGTGRTRILYLPKGTYRLTRTLVVHFRVGPWIFGETRDGVVLRMTDGLTDTNVTAVIRTLPAESNAGSADWFMRNLRNVTVDAGDNPRIDGLRWFSNNSGALKNVRVRGNGAVGVNLGFAGQNGPTLVQDVTIEGFATGVRVAWTWGATLSRITVRHARTEGVYVNATAVGIEDLKVEDAPCALRNEYPNDWKWWGGVVALVGGEFTGGRGAQAAITNTSVLYARDVVTTGFMRALDSTTPGGGVPGDRLGEYLSHPVVRLFDDAPAAGLRLPIRPEPTTSWETNTANWVGVQDFGALPGDNRDDTAAIQAAIDAAAAAGRTTIYFPGIGGGDPNWYSVDGTIRVHGSVCHLIGLGFGRLIGGETGGFLVGEDAAPVVTFQNLQAFGGRPPLAENRSRSRTMVVESSDLRILGTGAGDIFVTDCPSHIELRQPGQALWARQLNPEGTSDLGLVRNRGGRLWALGVKHEGKGVRWRTEAGGQTEILGLFNYAPGDLAEDDPRPAFDVTDAAFALMGAREISFGESYPVKLREVRRGETRQVMGGGWIGWALYRGHPAAPAADVGGPDGGTPEVQHPPAP